jgi:hypothetical protein
MKITRRLIMAKSDEQIRKEIAKVVGLLIEFFAKDQN